METARDRHTVSGPASSSAVSQPSRSPKCRGIKEVIAPASPSKSAARSASLAQQTRRGVEELERQRAELVAFAQSRARLATSTASIASDARHSALTDEKSRDFFSRAQSVQKALIEKQEKEAALERIKAEARVREEARSSGFADKPGGKNSSSNSGAFSRATPRAGLDQEEDVDLERDDLDFTPVTAPQRGEDLSLIESLEPGPRRLPPPRPDDPKWEKFEPYSGHALRERKCSHADLTEHLRGRYHISPSLLYSVARKTERDYSNGALRRKDRALGAKDGDYEVPVDGDWICIATIVEKSKVYTSKAFLNEPSGDRHQRAFDQDEDETVLFKNANVGADGSVKLDLEPGSSNDVPDSRHGRRWHPLRKDGIDEDSDEEQRKEQIRLSKRPRKYIVLKLLDLGCSSSSALGEGSSERGDNYLSMIVFESDQIDVSFVHRNTNVRSEVAHALAASASSHRKWVNGSRGAFEALFTQPEGTVVAVMNPKVLNPYGSRGVEERKMLRLSPRSGEDILIIGQAADYRRCSATKADGQRCSNFVDVKARSQAMVIVCDFHLGLQMDGLSKGRPEFSANATTKIGIGGPSGGRAGSSSSSGGLIGNDRRNTSWSTQKSTFAKHNLAKKLNSSFGQVGDGMENNSGQVFVSQSTSLAADGGEIRPSDPSSWKYDVSERYGRGAMDKQNRLKKQMAEERLKDQIQARFQPPSEQAAEERRNKAEAARIEPKVLPVLPNGSAQMIDAAYSTLEERKRKVAQIKAAKDSKRRRYTGLVPESSSQDHQQAKKLQFAQHSSARGFSSLNLPIAGLTRSSATAKQNADKENDARSKLLSLARGGPTPKTIGGVDEPSLKIKKCHRPKLRFPTSKDAPTKLVAIGGDKFANEDFLDWEDDLLQNDNEHDGISMKLVDMASARISRHTSTEQQDSGSSDLEIV